jgi:hypothetical protein
LKSWIRKQASARGSAVIETGKLKDDKPRQELLVRTRTNLDKIVNDKGQNDDGDLGILIGKVINQIKVGKFLTTLIQNGTIS